MSSHSDMESVSISDVEMEDDQVEAVPMSQPAPQIPIPVAGISLPQSSMSQPNPRRVTMRERAMAMREARLRKNQAKSAKKQTEDTAGKKHAHFGVGEHEKNNIDDGASAQTSYQGPKLKKPHKENIEATGGPSVEANRTESPSVGSKRQGADGQKSEGQGTGKGRKAQTRKEKNARKQASQPKATEPSAGSLDPTDQASREDVPNGQHALSKDGSKTSKLDSTSKRDQPQRKRKSTSDAMQGGKASNDHGNESGDVVLLKSKTNASPTVRARKKAKVEKVKSVTSPKLNTKSQKKKGKTAPPLHSDQAGALDTKDAGGLKHGEVEVPPKKKKSSRKTSLADARDLGDDEPIVVRNKSGVDHMPPLKHPLASDTAAENAKLIPVKRRPGRPRKYPRPDASEPQAPAKKTVGEGDQVKTIPENQTEHQPKSRGRKPKRSVAGELEGSKKPSSVNGDEEMDGLKTKAAANQAVRSALKQTSTGEPAAEEIHKDDRDLEATDMDADEKKGTKEIIQGEAEANTHVGRVKPDMNTPPKATGKYKKERLQSVTKSRRFSFAPTASRDFGVNARRRQSLSHQEGLSRLTLVIDQLQREGEAFLKTQQQICDQLMPFSPETGAHVVSNVAEGYLVDAPVSDDDRKAIADAALHDAVMHAKLAYQALQRESISKLAENLVRAVKDWKDAKNAVLRDIIPDDMRPNVEEPVGTGRLGSEMVDVEAENDAMNEGEDMGGGEESEGIEDVDANGQIEAGITAHATLSAEAQEERQKAVNEIASLEKVEALKNFVGFAYTKLKLDCYRSRALLKLCEFEGGLSYDELYRITPLGKVMLKRKIASLIQARYLLERTVEMSAGSNVVLLYGTAPRAIKFR